MIISSTVTVSTNELVHLEETVGQMLEIILSLPDIATEEVLTFTFDAQLVFSHGCRGVAQLKDHELSPVCAAFPIEGMELKEFFRLLGRKVGNLIRAATNGRAFFHGLGVDNRTYKLRYVIKPKKAAE